MLFFRRKRGVECQENAFSFRIRKGILFIWKKSQKKFAQYLSDRTINIPTAKLKRYLVLFCIASFSGSIAVVVYPFIGYRSPSVAAPQKISFPVHLYKTTIEKREKDSIIPFRKYLEIIEFNKQLDSLQFSDKGKNAYDSLIKAYPGLQDSIRLLKALYYGQ